MANVVAITGGPCAGKTSAIEELRRRLGNAAAYVPEAATDLIMSGIAPWTCDSMLAFQTQVIALQLQREAAVGTAGIVICDRGIPDSRAYLTADEYARALAANGLAEQQALARYDTVVHLESVAKADPAAYTRANNTARFETAEEAVAADDRTASAWSAHPHFTRIPATGDFAKKVDALVDVLRREGDFGALER